jgi:DUF1680 family protein
MTETDIVVHLYARSTGTLTVGDQRVVLRQETAYPWDGAIQIRVEVEEPSEFGVRLRIPGWCGEARLTVNGEDFPLALAQQNGYVRIARRWQDGDHIVLSLEMPVERVYAHPDVRADAGRIALQRGPLVYCLESADNPSPLQRMHIPTSATLESRFAPDVLGGVTLIHGNALVLAAGDWSDTLYRTAPAQQSTHDLVAIPYYAWDHRQPGEMCVWMIATPIAGG